VRGKTQEARALLAVLQPVTVVVNGRLKQTFVEIRLADVVVEAPQTHV
jgi:hypothetical protein